MIRFTDKEHIHKNSESFLYAEKKGFIGECGCPLLIFGTTYRGRSIGAGAVVDKDVSQNNIAVGVPAKVIGKRGE